MISVPASGPRLFGDEKAPPPAREKKKPVPPAPPARAQLPEAGKHPAALLFKLVEKLSDQPVVPLNPATRKVAIHVSLEAGSQLATLEELKIILAAHGIYLTPLVDPDKSAVWIASRDRLTKEDELPAFTRVYKLSAKKFKRGLEAVEKRLKDWNDQQPQGSPQALALPIEATGKIIIRSPSEKIFPPLDEILKKAEEDEALSADAMHLFTFEVKNRRAAELEERLLGRLSAEEGKRLQIVIPQGRNLLLIRTFPELWQKAEKILQSLDVPQKNRTQVSKGGPGGKE